MKKCILFSLLGALMLMLMGSCNKCDSIYIDKNKSYFSDFEVKNDKVYIKNYITFKNNFDTEKSVTLSTKLPDDVAIGLLRNEEVKALNDDGSETVFVLPPNGSKSFDVIFIGEYAGTNLKHDKSLSEIIIKIVK